jgi:glyoxylase-like metal-dependent hydrolase (beta-lactamase superfamily II)
MIFQQLVNEDSGCLSYLIGCTEAGQAIVVDPGRDRVTEYLRLARKKGLRLAHVIETHTHADHISGARDLAATTKAAIHVHGSAGVAFEHQDVRDGDSIRVGNVEVRVAHTPGHTPGHTSYVLSSGSGKVFIQSDVTNVPYLFAANPGWHAFFDQDPAMAENARRKTYDMVVADKLQVQGFHFPFPGLGNVEKDGNGYRVIPAPWNPVI